MNAPFIETEKIWLASDVRHVCIKNNWYTRGTCEEYENMLNMVESYYPSDVRIFYVAEDIFEHSNQDYWIRDGGLSKEEAIESIMFVLANDVVKTFYKIY